MTPKRSIDWKNERFPIDDVTYLNFAAHAAIPRVALNAVRSSVGTAMRPHIVDGRSFFSVAASLRQTFGDLDWRRRRSATTCAVAPSAASRAHAFGSWLRAPWCWPPRTNAECRVPTARQP